MRVLADVSFVSRVELEYSQQQDGGGHGGRGKQRSQASRCSQWQFSGCISPVCLEQAQGGTREAAETRQQEEEKHVEWKVNKVMSHGGPFYE